MSRWRTNGWVVALGVFLASAGPALAQPRAGSTVSGSVVDELGAILPGANVQLQGPGVNRFQTDEDPPEVEGYELDEKGRARQLERLAEVKRSRSAADVRATLAKLSKAAVQENVNLMPLLIDCAKAYCTVGEMVDVLKEQWGEFQQPAVF